MALIGIVVHFECIQVIGSAIKKVMSKCSKWEFLREFSRPRMGNSNKIENNVHLIFFFFFFFVCVWREVSI
jgi:hypothetical protein